MTVSAAAGANADSADFVVSANKALAIAAGDTASTGTVTIRAVDNGLDGPNKQVTVSGAVSNGIGGYADPDDVTLTIADDEATPKVKLVLSRSTIAESGANNAATVTATMSPPSVRPTTVTVAFAAGADTDATDFVASPNKTLTIAAGDTASTGVVSVTAADNDLDEPNKSVSVTATASNAHGATNPDAATLAIADDDGAPSLSISAPRVDEGAQDSTATLRFQVKLSAPSGQRVTVQVSDARTGTATVASDYAVFSAAILRFAAGDTLKSVDVTVNGDGVHEPDETVIVQLSHATNATIATATGTGTIADDEAVPTVTLTLSRSTLPERVQGVIRTSVQAQLSAPSSAATTVTVSAAPGTDADSADFVVSANKALTIAAGDTASTGTVTIRAVDDAADGPNKQVTVSGTASNGIGGYSNPADVTLTIQDDDEPPRTPPLTPRLHAGSVGATEGGPGTTTVLRFTMRLSLPAAVPVTVNYADAGDGSATPGADYETFAAGTLTFQVGDTLQTVDVIVVGDDQQEGDETVVLALSGAVNVQLATTTATGTIVDDDAPPPPSLIASSPQVREGDDGLATLSYAVRLVPASAEEVRVDYADTGAGTATAGADYVVLAPGTLVFQPGDTVRAIQVRVGGDHANEPDETVVIAFSNAQGAPLSTREATGTILDDDGSVLFVDSPRVAEGDAAGARNGEGPATLVFTVALNPPSWQDVSVTYADEGAGTATPQSDYRPPAPGTLSFAPGETRKTVAVTVIGDDLDEPDETVVLRLSRATNAEIAGEGGAGTIVDDDGPPVLSVDSPAVEEGGPGETVAMRFAVRLSTPTAKLAAVDYADAGTGTAQAGADYDAVPPGRLVFAPGDTVRTVEVTIRGDALDEPDETIRLAFANPADAELPEDGAAADGTIVDDDGPPVLSVDSPAVEEGGPGETVAMRFAVRLSTPTAKLAAVDYADAGTGTAQAGADYDAVPPGRLVFAPGDTVRTVEVTIRGDALDEPDETIRLAFANPADAELPEDGAAADGTIVDDDEAPAISAESPSVEEGDDGVRPLTFRFRLDRPSSRRVTLHYADEGVGTATPGADYREMPPGALHFAPGETVAALDVLVIGDARHEPDETVVLRLSTPDSTIAATVAERVAGTIGNDDPDLVPSFGDAEIPPQRWMQGRAIRPLSLPPAQGGNAPVTYALRPALPPGLAFHAESRAIAGTPAAGRPVAAYRYVATDEDGDSATLAFTAEVVAIEQIRARLEKINVAILPEVARTWADIVSNAVAGRLAQAGRAGVGAGAWGHGQHRRLSAAGARSSVEWSGDVHALGAGADAGLGASVTLGVGATRLESDFGYMQRGEGPPASRGRHHSRLTGVHPYLGWSGAGARAWTTAGYAKGEVAIRDDEAGLQTAGGRVRMLAVGGAVRVFAGTGGGRVDAKGEGHVARFRLEDNGDLLSAVEVGVHRLRFALHAERSFRVGSGRALRPSVALGVRQDGGDGRTGTGMEAGGGVSASAWKSRLQVEAAARTLLVHGGGLAEWGVGGSLRIAPGADGRGLSLRLQPEWGVPQDGIERLWSGGVTERPGLAPPGQGGAATATDRPRSRLAAEMAYGVGEAEVLGAKSLLTPYAALGPDPRGSGKAWRFGLRLATTPNVGLGIGLEAARPGSGVRLEVTYNK